MRLTNHIKDTIIANAIKKAGITAEHESIRQRRADWAEAVRVKACGGEDGVKALVAAEKAIEAALATLPASLRSDRSVLRRDDDISVNVAGLSYRAKFNGFGDWGGECVYKNTPSSVTLLADDPLVAQFHEIENDQRELNDKRTNIIANLRAVLDKVTTDKALVKQWPEAVELLPSSSEAVKATLPAIPVEDLNKMIGLPTGE